MISLFLLHFNLFFRIDPSRYLQYLPPVTAPVLSTLQTSVSETVDVTALLGSDRVSEVDDNHTEESADDLPKDPKDHLLSESNLIDLPLSSFSVVDQIPTNGLLPSTPPGGHDSQPPSPPPLPVRLFVSTTPPSCEVSPSMLYFSRFPHIRTLSPMPKQTQGDTTPKIIPSTAMLPRVTMTPMALWTRALQTFPLWWLDMITPPPPPPSPILPTPLDLVITTSCIASAALSGILNQIIHNFTLAECLTKRTKIPRERHLGLIQHKYSISLTTVLPIVPNPTESEIV